MRRSASPMSSENMLRYANSHRLQYLAGIRSNTPVPYPWAVFLGPDKAKLYGPNADNAVMDAPHTPPLARSLSLCLLRYTPHIRMDGTCQQDLTAVHALLPSLLPLLPFVGAFMLLTG